MTLSAIEYLYRPMYRHAHNSAFPPDVKWDYVEAPANDPMIAVRRGLPLSRQPFGVIALNRRLTSQERTEYQMEDATDGKAASHPGEDTMTTPPFEAEPLAQWLLEHNACEEAREWAAGKNLREIWDTCQRGDWLEWLLAYCNYQWTAQARACYRRVTDQALACYRRVTDQALACYWRVKADALAEYQRVTADALAQPLAEYQRVTADAIRKIVPYPFK